MQVGQVGFYGDPFSLSAHWFASILPKIGGWSTVRSKIAKFLFIGNQVDDTD